MINNKKSKKNHRNKQLINREDKACRIQKIYNSYKKAKLLINIKEDFHKAATNYQITRILNIFLQLKKMKKCIRFHIHQTGFYSKIKTLKVNQT